MHNFSNLENSFREHWIDAANIVLKHLFAQSPWVWAVAIGVAIVLLVFGLRLTRFSHPKHPRWSAIVRQLLSRALIWPSGVAVFVAVMVVVFVVGTVSRLQAWDHVSGALSPRLVGLAIGVVIALLISTYLSFWVLPGWETPRADAADAAAVVPSLANYDPERFFKIERRGA